MTVESSVAEKKQQKAEEKAETLNLNEESLNVTINP